MWEVEIRVGECADVAWNDGSAANCGDARLIGRWHANGLNFRSALLPEGLCLHAYSMQRMRPLLLHQYSSPTLLLGVLRTVGCSVPTAPMAIGLTLC